MNNLKKTATFQAPLDLLKETARLGRLPVVNFAAGGLATPADCSLLMQLGVDGCFVGSGIFKRYFLFSNLIIIIFFPYETKKLNKRACF